MRWRLQDSSFVLKIVYPGLCQAGTLGGYATCQMRGTTPVNWLIWSQTSNPMRTGNQQAGNYVAIDVQAQYVHTHLYASTRTIQHINPCCCAINDQPLSSLASFS
jgi:hypothetical protein